MKTIVLPGWMKSLQLYRKNFDFHECSGSLDDTALHSEFVVGFSLGALETLQVLEEIKGKVILINPPLPKHGLVTWFFHWIRYVTSNGLYRERNF